MNLKRFNTNGVEAFRSYLTALQDDPMISPPFHLLSDSYLTSEIGNIEVSSQNFQSRFEAAVWLLKIIDSVSIATPSKDVGLWSWLSLLHFDAVCPFTKAKGRKPGHVARHIPEVGNFQRYYRHLLAGPWSIIRAYRENPESALSILCQPLYSPGDIVEQLASRQELVTNRALISAATILYVDTTSRLPRRGSGGKSKGAPRRLAAFYNQLDVTYDMYTINTDELLQKLPKEFARFKP